MKTGDDQMNDFEIIYKAMLSSDDYNSKKTLIEKKLKKVISTIKLACRKCMDDKDEIEKRPDMAESEVEKLTDLE